MKITGNDNPIQMKIKSLLDKQKYIFIKVEGYHELRDISVKEASCAFFNIVPKKASTFLTLTLVVSSARISSGSSVI